MLRIRSYYYNIFFFISIYFIFFLLDYSTTKFINLDALSYKFLFFSLKNILHSFIYILIYMQKKNMSY